MTPGQDGFRTQAWVAVLTAGILAAASLLLLGGGPGSRPWVERASYDLLYHAAARNPVAPPVMLVYLDRESYLREGQSPDAPWSRGLHAALVRRLTAARARTVVFDIVFDGPGAAASEDRALQEAIRSNGRVVLAAELNGWQREAGSGPAVTSLSPVLPHAPLLEAAAGWGLASLQVDEDFTVRRYFPGLDRGELPSLTEAAARSAGAAPEPVRGATPGGLWLRYQGPPLSLPHVSYSAALRRDEVPDEVFRDRVVVIGARPMITGFTERRDEFRNPWPAPGHGVASMPAVEVHATQIANRLSGGFLTRPSPRPERIGLLLTAVLVPGLLFRFRPAAAAGVALLLELLWIGTAVVLFARGNLWYPWLLVAGVQIPGALAGTVLFHSVDWYRQRRRLEAARREAEARIREQAALLDKAQDAILVQQCAGAVTYVNPAAERLSGWMREEWIRGTAAPAVFAKAGAALLQAREECDATGEWTGELEWVTPRGDVRTVQSRWTLIRTPSGQPASRLLINTDITERRRLEAQFLRAQRLETVGHLAGGMAHDLNSALAPVLMGIQLLRRDTRDAEALQMLEAMEANTRRGAEMVRQVLHFSRGASDARRPVQPAPFLAELERLVRQSFPHSIAVRRLCPADLWTVEANPTQLHQVLLNLCINARDAMPQGGELTLAADNVALGPQEAAGIPGGHPGEFVMWVVGDTGVGIPEEVRVRIFEPFFTTKAPGQGTGLGLSTVARIVGAHGGFLSVSSEPGAGTLFEVYLPRAVSAPAPDGLPAPAAAPAGRGECVVILDGNQAVGGLLAEALTAQGYQARATDSPAGFRTAGGCPGPVAAVLVDAGIPWARGASGTALIRQEFPGAVVCWMIPEDEEPACGSDPFLKKPLGMDRLFEQLDRVLHARPK
ncbi:MAG: CHASE2 domain-containing protein [Verrucomicrobia bacterium]|nr:CHASE2 domain-containing protein [Verrucomicrobiota bacterium]